MLALPGPVIKNYSILVFVFVNGADNTKGCGREDKGQPFFIESGESIGQEPYAEAVSKVVKKNPFFSYFKIGLVKGISFNKVVKEPSEKKCLCS